MTTNARYQIGQHIDLLQGVAVQALSDGYTVNGAHVDANRADEAAAAIEQHIDELTAERDTLRAVAARAHGCINAMREDFDLYHDNQDVAYDMMHAIEAVLGYKPRGGDA